MKKVTKAIKYAQALNDEEKAEFLEFFAKDEEETKGEVKVTEKQEEKKEEKKEEKEEKKTVDFEALFNGLSEKVNSTIKEVGTLKESLAKSKVFGAKAKTKSANGTNDFDTAFSNLPK